MYYNHHTFLIKKIEEQQQLETLSQRSHRKEKMPKLAVNVNLNEELSVVKESENIKEKNEKKSNWRIKHENFIKNLRKNRNKKKEVGNNNFPLNNID